MRGPQDHSHPSSGKAKMRNPVLITWIRRWQIGVETCDHRLLGMDDYKLESYQRFSNSFSPPVSEMPQKFLMQILSSTYLFIRIHTYIVSACRGLMELGGRLIECLPSFFLKCRNLCFLPMDSWAAFSLGGFVAGWLARDWSLRAPEIPICRCECNVGSSPFVADQSLVSGNSLLILLGVIGLVIALSNTALAFKVTYRDSETGQGREFAFDVKGKSKGQLGVFGSGKGLQITN